MPWRGSRCEGLWGNMEGAHRPLPAKPELIEQGVAMARASAGPRFEFEEARLRGLWTEMVARGNRPMARARQVSAGFFFPRPRPKALASSKVPGLFLGGPAPPPYPGLVQEPAPHPHPPSSSPTV